MPLSSTALLMTEAPPRGHHTRCHPSANAPFRNFPGPCLPKHAVRAARQNFAPLHVIEPNSPSNGRAPLECLIACWPLCSPQVVGFGPTPRPRRSWEPWRIWQWAVQIMTAMARSTALKGGWSACGSACLPFFRCWRRSPHDTCPWRRDNRKRLLVQS